MGEGAGGGTACLEGERHGDYENEEVVEGPDGGVVMIMILATFILSTSLDHCSNSFGRARFKCHIFIRSNDFGEEL